MGAETTEILTRLEAAHRCSSIHRVEVLSSQKCGCFYCNSIFPPAEISEWVDENASGEGQTALCPKCGIDAVIGDRSGVPLTAEFLDLMRQKWFT